MSKAGLLLEGMREHDLAVNGEAGAAERALAHFAAARRIDDADPLLLAYTGSAQALVGRDAEDPNVRIAQSLAGLKLLDRAVEARPDDIQIRMLRGFVGVNLPETFFHRSLIAADDFAYVAARYEQEPALLGPGAYWNVLFHRGKALRQAGADQQAVETWLKLRDLGPDVPTLRLLRSVGMEVELPEDRLAADPERNRLLNEGRALHRAAEAGDKQAASAAYDHFQRALERYPGDPLIDAYAAGSLSLVAASSTDAARLFTREFDAIKRLDQAVRIDPQNLEIRLLRAGHADRLPEGFFHRTATAIADYEFVVRASAEEPGALPAAEIWEAHLRLAEAYARLSMHDDAKAVRERLAALDPPPDVHARLARDADEITSTIDPGAPIRDWTHVLVEAIRLHELGRSGSARALVLARDLLERAHAHSPQDPLVTAYLGSTLALLGVRSNNPSELFTGAIEGLRTVGDTAKRVPSLRVRWVRGRLYAALPDAFFHMRAKAIEDLEYVLRIVKTRRFAKSSADARALTHGEFHELLYELGLLHAQTDDLERARTLWTRLLGLEREPERRERALRSAHNFGLELQRDAN